MPRISQFDVLRNHSISQPLTTPPQFHKPKPPQIKYVRRQRHHVDTPRNARLCSRYRSHRPHMNLTELLDAAASRWPQKPAIVEDSDTVSYAGLVERISTLAAQLQTL